MTNGKMTNLMITEKIVFRKNHLEDSIIETIDQTEIQEILLLTERIKNSFQKEID
jgi:hypothetical protein